MAPGTYGKTWWREGYACGCMIQSIEDIVEPRLKAAGYKTPVNIFQQAYNTSVEASGGTHSGGGALDHGKGSDGETVIWRECGWADWQRGSPEDSYFDDHNHGIVQGCPHLAGAAADQVVDYKNGRNGLADNGKDQSPHVAPITWTAAYDKYKGSTSGGVLGMTDTDKWSRSVDQNVAKDTEWHLMKIDDDDNLSLVTGPMSFVAICCLTVGGLAPGQVLQVRFARVYDYSDKNKATTVEAWYPIKEIIGTQGDAFDQIVWAQYIGNNAPSGAKEKMRLYVSAVDAACVVKGITTRVLHD